MSSEGKEIGRVLSVDNFRVYIRIDSDLLGTYKSGVHDIYEIARINSYLIIPVGSDRIVSLINRVSMKEEYELEKKYSIYNFADFCAIYFSNNVRNN